MTTTILWVQEQHKIYLNTSKIFIIVLVIFNLKITLYGDKLYVHPYKPWIYLSWCWNCFSRLFLLFLSYSWNLHIIAHSITTRKILHLFTNRTGGIEKHMTCQGGRSIYSQSWAYKAGLCSLLIAFYFEWCYYYCYFIIIISVKQMHLNEMQKNVLGAKMYVLQTQPYFPDVNSACIFIFYTFSSTKGKWM